MDDIELLPGCSEKQLEFIRKLRLIDDIFMTKVFEDKECVQLLLKVILNRSDLTVTYVKTQFEITSIQGLSIRLDVYAVDNKKRRYNIEIQRDDDGADPRRARYNNCLLDSNSLKKRQDVKKLPETYIIFITENDVLKGGLPIYTINRHIEELGNKIFKDGTHIIYVNGENRDDTDLGRLMQDFFCTEPENMNNEVLSERAGYLKHTKEGYRKMSDVMEEYSKWREEMAAEAAAKAKSNSIALKLWNKGIRDYNEIAELTDLSLDEVKELLKDKTA